MMFSDFSPMTSLQNLAETLDTFGVAVLPNVFSEEECDNLKEKVFKYLEREHTILKADDYEKLRPLQGGILHYYGISLLEEVLDMKTDDRVVEPFRVIWNNDEVTTSLDGMYIAPPPEITTKQKFFNPSSSWFHTDQSSHKNFMCCIQAFINLEHTESGDGCLSVLTGSHKYHHEFFTDFNINTHGLDWFMINKTNHIEWFINKGCEWRTICAPKGSMVFWDSRTIHMGTAPRKYRPNQDRWRFVIYVCYTPAYRQTKEDAKLKRNAYIQNRCTAHWPYGVNVFQKAPDDFRINDLKNLKERHKKFLGIN